MGQSDKILSENIIGEYENEQWRDIADYVGMYQVSNMGRVRSLDRIVKGKNYQGKILSSNVTYGYPIVRLSNGSEKKSRRVHRLVAQSFLDNPLGLEEVNHKDGNKKNNCVENLEWCTPKENKIHAWVTGLTKKPPAEKPVQVAQLESDIVIAVYKSIEIAALLLNISGADICKCCKGKRDSAGGYTWKYLWEVKGL